MNLWNLLKLLQGLETKLGQLYAKFSKDFAGQESVSRFFYRLSREEEQHANLVKYQQKLVSGQREREKQVAVYTSELDIDTEEIETMLNSVDYYLETAQSMPLQKALKVTVIFESSAAENHYKTATADVFPELTELLLKLADEDKAHKQRVMEFASTHGVSLQAEE